MRIFRFLSVLCVLFLISFGISGGATLWQKWSSTLPASTSAVLPADTAASVNEAAGAWDRIWRIIALKSAVEGKLDRRNYVKIKDIPLTLQQAVIATEDHRFYNHVGFDFEGILRATLVNVQAGGYAEGASTITQQLIKNLFLSQDKTITRKAEEFVLAVDMELRYSKEEILEMYLNSIYFGSGAYGIGPAAKIYFGKPPANLNLPEAALLAGIPNAPSLNSPYVNFQAAKQRQAIVLGAMVKYNYLGPQAAEEARLTPVWLAN
ncbi:transglycosylase domain-containing protein [Azotosporobacter soli]|uniref:transglycosylase domain-containing protein n=1 Tax=Azotosporobacter soli TaxID=3055040 RepID=UPI0031FF142D